MESSKVYVNVMAEFTNDERLLPGALSGRMAMYMRFRKNRCKRRAASLKAGGAGIRYTGSSCMEREPSFL